MKKVLLMIVTLMLVASSIIPVYAEEQEELFIGLIEKVENDMVKVQPLFNLKHEYKENDVVYIDISKIDTKDQTFPEGYLISINYKEESMEGDKYIVVASSLSAVEPNAEASICGTTEIAEQDDELFIGKIIKVDGSLVQVEPVFDLEHEYKDSDVVYINLENVDVKNQTFPEGYLMTVNYKDIVTKDDHYEVIASDFIAVEEEQVMTTFEVPKTDEEDKDGTVVDTSFFDKFLSFFKNLFSW